MRPRSTSLMSQLTPGRISLTRNVTGTLALIEAALDAGIDCFVYVSTTSTFGLTLTPVGTEPAAWITENLIPKSKNVYGVSKLMAESLCEVGAQAAKPAGSGIAHFPVFPGGR